MDSCCGRSWYEVQESSVEEEDCLWIGSVNGMEGSRLRRCNTDTRRLHQADRKKSGLTATWTVPLSFHVTFALCTLSQPEQVGNMLTPRSICIHNHCKCPAQEQFLT